MEIYGAGFPSNSSTELSVTVGDLTVKIVESDFHAVKILIPPHNEGEVEITVKLKKKNIKGNP